MNRNKTVLLCCVLAATALRPCDAKTADLKSLRAIYDKSSEKMTGDHAVALEDLKTRYETSLKNLSEKYRRAGNLDMLLEVRKEMKRFEEDRSVPAESPATIPDSVRKTQITYKDYLKRARTDHATRMIGLMDRYARRLQELVVELTKQAQIDDAIRVRDEIKKIDFVKADFIIKFADVLEKPKEPEVKIDPKPEPKPKPRTEPKPEPKPVKTPAPVKMDKRQALEAARRHYQNGVEQLRNREFDRGIAELKKSLDLQNAVLGGKHLNIASTYTSLAHAYHAKSEYRQAIEYGKKAVEMATAVVGADHPLVAAGYMNMSSSYMALAEYRNAYDYMQKAHMLNLKKFGALHENTKKSKQRLEQLKRMLRK